MTKLIWTKPSALVWCGLCLLAAQPALAQQYPSSEPAQTPAAQGYVFGVAGKSIGGSSSSFGGVGGGGEGFVYRGLAAGGEAGYYGRAEQFGDGFGIASANVSYHFRSLDSKGKIAPFVTGGYSLAFRSGASHLVNYGGGATYWFHRRVGVRVEVRNHQRGDFSLLGFRFGLSFR